MSKEGWSLVCSWKDKPRSYGREGEEGGLSGGFGDGAQCLSLPGLTFGIRTQKGGC